MQLYIKRSQRDKGLIFKKTIFMLDVRLDLTADELHLMKKHKFFKEVIYRSLADRRHTEKLFNAGRVYRNQLFLLIVMIVRYIAKLISSRCTYKSLYKGQHLACADLFELSENEQSLHSACERAITYLDAIRRYDGRENLYAFTSKEKTHSEKSHDEKPHAEIEGGKRNELLLTDETASMPIHEETQKQPIVPYQLSSFDDPPKPKSYLESMPIERPKIGSISL